ncbi:MAG TPA: ChbG/HpnK family deacetylase [Solirubrobacteraceae bacterium]|nr:ChbG/HpnK family deacetylase [Solirubrobacteraceae bacterium]
MRYLIVNADDFGLSPGVTEGILAAHTRGIVTSTSLMVFEPAAEQAGRAAREHPSLSVGLHFVEPEPVDLDDPDQAAAAFAEQVARFRALTGADPTHVDSHHHVHSEEDRMSTFVRLVAPLGLPLRHDGHVAYIGGFWAQWEPDVTELRYISREFLLELVRAEALEGFTELACHPARITGDFSSSYLTEREVELATLTESGLREEIEALGVRLVNYRDWSRLQRG